MSSPQHKAVADLIARGIHKQGIPAAASNIWRAAFKDCLEWRYVLTGTRYLYLNLTWDAVELEWSVNYAAPGMAYSKVMRVSEFFGSFTGASGEIYLRFTPLEGEQ